MASLTVMRSSLSSKLAPSFLQEIVGSGCPRGGWHSSTAGSPTATITSTGFCLKSSRKTGKHRKAEQSIEWNLLMFDHDLTMINHNICSYCWCLQVGFYLLHQQDFNDWKLKALSSEVIYCMLVFFLKRQSTRKLLFKSYI